MRCMEHTMSAQPRILVVDDEPHIVQVISVKLAPAGFNVFEAGDAIEALELAEKWVPHLVITDYVMPEVDGLELCQLMRARPTLADVPVLVLTGMPLIMPDPPENEKQVVEVLTKPFSPRELLLRVQTLLDAVTVKSLAS